MKKDVLILILAVLLVLFAWPIIESKLGDTGRLVVGIGIILVIMLSRFNIKPSMPRIGKQQWKPPKQQPPQQHRGQQQGHPPRSPGHQQPQPQRQFDRGQSQGQFNQGKQRGMPQQGQRQQQQQQFSRGQPQRQPQYPQQQGRPQQQQYRVPYVEDYEDKEYYEE